MSAESGGGGTNERETTVSNEKLESVKDTGMRINDGTGMSTESSALTLTEADPAYAIRAHAESPRGPKRTSKALMADVGLT